MLSAQISDVIDNQKALRVLVAFMRDLGVSRVELNGLSLEIDPKAAKPAEPQGEPQADRLPEPTEEQKKKEEDDLLFHSSG